MGVIAGRAVFVIDELCLVTTLDWTAEPAFRDRPRIGIMQRHDPRRAGRNGPTDTPDGLGRDAYHPFSGPGGCGNVGALTARRTITEPFDPRRAFRTNVSASCTDRRAIRTGSRLIRRTSARFRLHGAASWRRSTGALDRIERVRSVTVVRDANPWALILRATRMIFATPFANKLESDGYATFASITVVSARIRFVFNAFASAPGSTTPRSAH